MNYILAPIAFLDFRFFLTKYKAPPKRLKANAATANASPMMRGRDSPEWLDPTGDERVVDCEMRSVGVEEETERAEVIVPEGRGVDPPTVVDPSVELIGLEFVTPEVELKGGETDKLVSGTEVVV